MNTQQILQSAKSAKQTALSLSTNEKNKVLLTMAQCLLDFESDILKANDIDIKNASDSISGVMIDRLKLTPQRILDMANALRHVATLHDPIGEVIDTNVQSGLNIKKIRVPMGVIAIIYESRPNVTADAAALCFKSGNVCVLRGGKEAINSNIAISTALKKALAMHNLPENLINLIQDTKRESATQLMQARGYVDLLIPRGGAGLIRSCVENAKVPCIETGTGICHIYVDKYADINMALNIVNNAKTSRPSVCNAAEVCLVHKDIAHDFLPKLQKALNENHKVEMRLCENSLKIINGTPAEQDDFNTEFLDYILAVKIVNSTQSAVEHILNHSTYHSEAIITQNKENAAYFTKNVDSACVYVNASTRFTDGGVFGLGCEIGISTQKLGARGPMGLKEMTSYKYIIEGNGNIR